MRRPSVQTVAAAIVLSLLGLVALVTWRPDAAPADDAVSTDYGHGGYRAWAALLEREGVTTSRFVLRPIELDARIDTLVSAQPVPGQSKEATRSAADLAALAAWVRAGGRLVYLGRDAPLQTVETEVLDVPFELPEAGAHGALTGPLATSVGMLAGLGPDRMLFVEHAGRSELADDRGDIVARYALGRGEIVAVSDAGPFENAAIGSPGNARLAYLLGLPRRPGGVVAFDDGIHGALIDRPWYRALPVPVRVTLAILALAGGVAAIGAALRTGPPVRLAPEREPDSGEFVEALARLYERRHARSAAAAILVEDALAAAARSSGSGERDAPDRIADRITDPIRSAAIRRLGSALGAPLDNDADFIASAALAHIVRKDSDHDGARDRRRSAFASRTRTRRRR